MSFRDQLSALIADDKKDAAKKVFDALDEQLTGYDTDIKELKTKLREKDGIKPEDFTALEKERDDLKKELTESQRLLKTTTTERDKLKADYAETSTKARDYQTGVTLREALGKVGIGKLNPEDVIDAIGFVKSMLKYNDKGEALVSYKDATGKEIEQALGEYVEKVYPTTTHAKRFIPAAGNGGTGGGLNLKKADGQAKKWSEMDLKERTILFRENPAAAKQLQEAEPSVLG